MLVAGTFKQINGTPRNYIARVLADGSLDPDFNPDASATINHVSIQPDGRILLGGKFTSINRHPRNRLARLHPDGRVDESFNPNVDGEVYGTLIQPDGRIVFYGSFSKVGNQSHYNLARIDADGILEPNFNFSKACLSLQQQTDGVILCGGSTGDNLLNLTRILANGTLDSLSNLAMDGIVLALAVQADGRILFGGKFSSVANDPHRHVARLINDEATQSLLVTAYNDVRWLRGGASPEANEVSFEWSATGTAPWTKIGRGVRIPGGWRLSEGGLPASGQVRALARYRTGYVNDSTSLVEARADFSGFAVPEISILGNSVEIESGSAVPSSVNGTDFGEASVQSGLVMRTFTIANTGAAPLTFSATPRLQVLGAQAGDFTVSMDTVKSPA